MKPLPWLLFSTILLTCTLTSRSWTETYNPSLERYAALQEEATELFNKGQMTQAIDRFEQALPLADVNSRGPALNNLAAAYMRRANFLAKTDSLRALNDYRQAYYLFFAGWPSDLAKTEAQRSNTEIARQNLLNAYRQNRISLTDAAVHRQLGQSLRQAGQFREALVEFGWATQINGKDADAWLAMGDLENVLNRPTQAATSYQKAVTLAGDAVAEDWLLRLANMQNKAGNANAAIATLNKITDKNPDNTTALAMLERLWKEEHARQPDSYLPHANLASVFQKQKRFDAAALAYKNAEALLARNPQATPIAVRRQVHLNHGTLYQQTGRYDEAQRFYEDVLRENPGNPEAAANLASLFAQMKQPARAIRMYSDLLLKTPNQPALVDGLLQAISQLPNDTEKRAARQTLAQRFTSQADVQEGLAEQWHADNQLPEAVAGYRATVALAPDRASAWANLGSALLAQGNKAEALSALQRAQTLDPTNATVKGLLSKVQQGEQQQRVAQLIQQASQQYEAANYTAALQTAQQVTRLTATNDQGWLYQGLSLSELKRYKEAIVALNKALALNASLKEANYALGISYEATGQRPAAKTAFERYIAQAGPDPEEAELVTYAQQRVEALKH